MDPTCAKIHLIPEDGQESKDGKTAHFDAHVDSNVIQTQNHSLQQGSASLNDHKETSESSNGWFQGSTKVMLLERLQNYSKLTRFVGATFLENDAIQLRDRLISYRKQHQLQNNSSRSLPQYTDTSKELDRQNNVLVSDHHDLQSSHEKEEHYDTRDGYEKLVPVQESSTSIDSVKLQLKAHPERSSSHQSGVFPLSPVLEKCKSKDNYKEKLGASRTLRSDEMFPDKLCKRKQSTAFGSTTNGEDKNTDNDLKGDSEKSFTCDEGEYLCNRAKRMKKMASLLLQIENLHDTFIVQVIDFTINDDTPK